MYTDRLTLLGTGTCQLQEHRMASSILVEFDELRFVYDFGRGTTQRLIESGLQQDDLRHIIFSHYHPDHISDLIPYLQAACWSQIDRRSKPLHLYGPEGLEKQIGLLLGLFDENALSSDTFTLELHELPAGPFSIEDRHFEFIHLPPHNNHGLAFSYRGYQYAFTGDSGFHIEEIALLENSDFAVIDAGHITDEEIIDLAVHTQVDTLVCSHLYRELDQKRLGKEASRKGFKGEIVVGEDLLEFELE